jgi:hypothetical protein
MYWFLKMFHSILNSAIYWLTHFWWPVRKRTGCWLASAYVLLECREVFSWLSVAYTPTLCGKVKLQVQSYLIAKINLPKIDIFRLLLNRLFLEIAAIAVPFIFPQPWYKVLVKYCCSRRYQLRVPNNTIATYWNLTTLKWQNWIT